MVTTFIILVYNSMEMIKMTKNEIFKKTTSMMEAVYHNSKKDTDSVSVTNYSNLVYTDEEGREIWTEAFSAAIKENEHILIPATDTPYYIDKPVFIPSDRYIEAEDGACIRLKKGTKTLLFRNENNEDGTHKKETFQNPDKNIHIYGGKWEEEHESRKGYGSSGMYDENRTFYGVSTCMFFNNIENLILENLTFSHAGGFGIQMGNVKNVVIRNIKFESCYADGIHINGNTECIYINHVEGHVGDDLVALNMYDWQDSSVDFGPIKTVWCEDLNLYPESGYKAMRIEPGTYYYNNGDAVDCSLNDAVIKTVRGIKTFKLYFQTPRYKLTESPEKGDVGSGDNIYFEDIVIDLTEPIDKVREYLESDPVTGSIAGFEIGANIGNLYFENIDITLHRDEFPMSFLACVGPKSVRAWESEFFDPYINCTVENIYLKNVKVSPENTENYIHEIVFNDIYNDGTATGKGTIKNIKLLD